MSEELEDASRRESVATRFGIKRRTGSAEADQLADLLVEHLIEPWPSDVPRGESFGSIEPVMAQADVFGWSLAALHGALSDTDRARLSSYADEIEASLGYLAPIGRTSFELLVELARAAVKFRPNRGLAPRQD
jgi:hypothetical protein